MRDADTIRWILDHQVPPALGAAEALSAGVREGFSGRIEAVLDYHVEQFRALDQVTDSREVAVRLAEGRFAARPFQGCNLWHDVMLAAGLAGGLNAAARSFHERFDEPITGWARRFASDDHEAADDFMGALVTPRKRSGPPIESYKGYAPLLPWLKQVFITHADRRRKSRGTVVDAEAAHPDAVRTTTRTDQAGELPPDEAYALQDCQNRLAPLLKGAFDALSTEEHTVVKMSVVDNVPQKKIAQLLGVRDYKVTRIKQKAFQSLRDTFLRLARSVAQFTEDALHDCVGLVLARFGLPR